MPEPRWTEQQQRVLEAGQHELLVSAAAGSGKTAVLIERVVQAALGSGGRAPVPLDRLLVITFTRSAARELKHRLNLRLQQRRTELAAAADQPETRRALDNIRRQLEALPRAQISTIDSFFLDLVRRYGHTRNIAVSQMLSEDETRLTRHEIATALLEEQFASREPQFLELALMWGGIDGLGPEDLSAVQFETGLRRHLLGLHSFLQSLADPAGWAETMLAQGWLDEEQYDPAHPLALALATELARGAEQEQAADSALDAQLGDACPDAVYREMIGRRRNLLQQQSQPQDWDSGRRLLGLLAEKQDDIPWKPTLVSDYKRDIQDETCKGLIEQRAADFKKYYERWRSLFSVEWAEVARRQNQVQRCLQTLLGLVSEFDSRFTHWKQGQRRCDFSDLGRYALQLLAVCDNLGNPLPEDGRLRPSACALELRNRFELVVIDEYQDTNELQDAVISLATREVPGSGGAPTRPRLVVGDIKQSIYAFRLADPRVFAGLRRRLEQGELAGEALQLSVNFRSRAAVLEGINWLFSGLMTEDFGGDNYPENRLHPGLDYPALFKAHAGAPTPDTPVELQLVDTSAASAEPDAEADDENGAEDGELSTRQELVYRRVAEVLRSVRESAQLVYNKEAGAVRPVQWRDMVVLLRTAAGRVETLRALLADAGVPCYIPSRSGFYQRPEIADALALLSVLDNPRQDIALATVLSGPALRLDHLQLLELARGADGLPSLWDRMLHYTQDGASAELRGRIGDFLALYHGWRDAAAQEGLGELSWRVFTQSGLLAAAAAQPGSHQRLNNLIQLHELARSAEREDRRGLGRFLRFLELSRQAKGDAGEAPMLGEGEDVVRVLTVHQAKGLEFPVVIVPDLHTGFNRMDLNTDVVWHRTAGLGGTFYDLAVSPPQRAGTLGKRWVTEARLRDLAAEQLRLLYVALTRAREHLVLVSAIEPRDLQRLQSPQRPEQARCWLDWVGSRLGPELAALFQPDAPAELTAAGGWLLRRSAGPAVETATDHVEPAAEGRQAAAEYAQALQRLDSSYPHAASANLPLKATASGLGRRSVLENDEESHGLSAAAFTAPAAQDAAAAAGQYSRETALALGSAVHLLLEHINLSSEPAADDVANLLAELAGAGLVAAETASLVDAAEIAATARGLVRLAAERNAQIHRELPLGIFAPAAWLGPAAAGDHVYVQGIIDALLVGEDCVLVIDFKTDHSSTPDELRARYSGQLGWYCRMVAALLPGRRIEWALFHTGGHGLLGPWPAPPA